MRPEYIPRLARFRELDRLQRYYESKQYEGRADFWTGRCGNDQGAPVPLRERKPCITYPLPKAACQQVVRFTFGEGKFPTLSVEAQKDDVYEALSLSDEEAELLERGITNVIENGRFQTLIRTLMARGLAERTAVAVLSVKRGRFAVDVGHAKDFAPVFKNGDPNDELLSVTWCYTYEKEVEGKAGPEKKRFWFRRDVTEQAYVDYEPVEFKIGEDKVEWPAGRITEHGYGFCPVLWIRNLDEGGEKSSVDGVSLYEEMYEEFDALNFALSQRHRGITFFGVPQPWESGVEPGDGPGEDGRKAGGYTRTSGGMWAEVERGKGGQSKGPVTEKARRLAPDNIWSYEGDANLGLLETTGKAFEVASLHVEDIRGRTLESMSVVLANIDQFVKGGGDMNAKFLQLAFAPLLNLVAELRDATWWPQGLLGLISMALRMLAMNQGDGIVMPEAATLAKLVARFEVTTTEPTPAPADGAEPAAPTLTKVWMLPKIKPVWGDSFEPSNGEVREAVDATVAAKDGGLVPLKQAVSYVADYFKIDDVDAAVAELEAEADAIAAEEADLALKTAEASKPPEGAKPPSPPGRSPVGPKPKT